MLRRLRRKSAGCWEVKTPQLEGALTATEALRAGCWPPAMLPPPSSQPDGPRLNAPVAGRAWLPAAAPSTDRGDCEQGLSGTG